MPSTVCARPCRLAWMAIKPGRNRGKHRLGVLVTVVQKVTVVNPLSLSGLSLLASCEPLG